MSVRFAADTDKLTLAAAPPGTWTMTCWAWLTSNRNYYSPVMGTFAGTTTYRYVSTDVDGVTLGFFGQAANVAGPAMTVAAWYRVAVTVTPGGAATLRWAPVGSATSSGSGTAGSTAVTSIVVGGSTFATEFLDGRLAYMRVWTTALTQTQIEAEWASATPVVTAGLWADWPLTVATDLTDHSGNGRHLINGSTAVTTEADPPVAAPTTTTGRFLLFF